MKPGLVFGLIFLIAACTTAQPVCPKVIVVKPEITIIHEGPQKIKSTKKIKKSAGHKTKAKAKALPDPVSNNDPISDRALLMPIDTEQDE